MTPADLSWMLPVTLAHDPDFQGYVIAPLREPDGRPARACIAIKQPGKTGLRGNKAFVVADLVPAPQRSKR